jgi:succinyl-CoA synthetase alpha subunit
MLQSALAPRSVAVIGASDNPHKVGGRPILYLQRYGYRGAIYPINPGRATVQGLRAFARLEDLPEAPELAIVAVAGDEAVRAVESCAAQGVKVAVVMASGFGETGPAGLRVQQLLVEVARRAGMRLIGPNCQGLANFATGMVANFSTIFHEMEGRDGPVAIVSQSGANSQAIYALVMKKGLGVRHVHATGNEADVTVADLAQAVVDDPGVRLLLLYMEAIKDPQRLAAAAEHARSRGVPIVALKAGRTVRGQKAASSHTGALASEDRVVDAFRAPWHLARSRPARAGIGRGALRVQPSGARQAPGGHEQLGRELRHVRGLHGAAQHPARSSVPGREGEARQSTPRLRRARQSDRRHRRAPRQPAAVRRRAADHRRRRAERAPHGGAAGRRHRIRRSAFRP